jgi:hypothetical protein
VAGCDNEVFRFSGSVVGGVVMPLAAGGGGEKTCDV